MSVTNEQTPYADLPVARRVGMRLHTFSNIISGNYYQRTEVPFGISLPEWRVLQAAIESPSASQGEIAFANGLNAMTVSRAVAGLRRKGLIEAEADPADRRRSLLTATELGQQIGRSIAERADEMYAHVFSTLSADEIAVLDSVMDRVNSHIQTSELPELPDEPPVWAALLAQQ